MEGVYNLPKRGPMKKLLFVNSCVLRETSRTNKIANALVTQLEEQGSYEVEELVLEDMDLRPLNSKTLAHRNDLLAKEAYGDPMFNLAHQFAEADVIVVAAPFWESSYPSLLKLYIEQVSVTGIVNRYTDHGPVGQCKAEKLYYVTTRGGFATDEADCGWQNIKGLCGVYGINSAECISVNATDIPTTDVEKAVVDAIARIPELIG